MPVLRRRRAVQQRAVYRLRRLRSVMLDHAQPGRLRAGHGLHEGHPGFGEALLQAGRAPLFDALARLRGREEERRLRARQLTARTLGGQFVPVRAAHRAAVGEPIAEALVDGAAQRGAAAEVDIDRARGAIERGQVRLWDVTRQQEIARFNGHNEAITALAFAPAGLRLATASRDGTARLWESLARQTIAVFGEGKDPITAIAFSPDGKRLVTGHADAYVRFWDLATRQEVLLLGEHTGSINTVAFSADGKRFATASEDKRWLLFRTEATTEVQVQFQ